MSTPIEERLRPVILSFDDRDFPPQPIVQVPMETVVGERFMGEQVYLPFMRLGGLQLGNVPVVFSDMHVFDLWRLHDKPAVVIGMDLLTQFDLTYDISSLDAADFLALLPKAFNRFRSAETRKARQRKPEVDRPPLPA